MNTVIQQESMLTFSNEGQNTHAERLYYTLKPHCPDGKSGVTIGKGYDMKMRSEKQIKQELLAAGIDKGDAEKLSKAAGLYGDTAVKFVHQEDISGIRISKESEATLFNLVYGKAQKDAQRMCEKKDVVYEYGACDWKEIDGGIKTFVADLTFRGDYSGGERKHIQKAVVTNDYDALIKLASDKTKWKGNLDNNRFNARILHLKTSKNQFDVKQGASKKITLP